MQTLDQEVVTGIVEELLGHPADHIEAFKPPSGGLGSWSFRLRHGDDDLYMKLNHRPDTPLGIHFHTGLRQAGLPVPELVAWYRGAGPEELPCAIWEFIDGDQANWLKTRSCPYDESQCGELLRQIHDLAFDGPYCFLGDEGPVSTYGPSTESWEEMFPCEHVAKRCFDLGWLDSQQADTLALLPERLRPALADAPRRLLHMDFLYNGNVIVERGGSKIIGIVDGAESMAGDPRLELAYFDLGFPGSGWDFDMAAFRAGYGTNHDPCDELSRFYMVNLLLCTRFMTGDINEGMARRDVLLIRTMLQTFE